MLRFGRGGEIETFPGRFDRLERLVNTIYRQVQEKLKLIFKGTREEGC